MPRKQFGILLQHYGRESIEEVLLSRIRTVTLNILASSRQQISHKEWSKNRQVPVTDENRSACMKHITARKFELWNTLQLKNLHQLQ